MRRRKAKKNAVNETIKPYVQFSKKIIRFCILNLIIIEAFVMFMVYTTHDTNVLPYLITSLAVQFLGCVIWYLKNSEAEKKVRIEAEIERMRLVSKGVNVVSKVKEAACPGNEPDTFYKGDESSVDDILPININNSSCIEEEDDSVG